MSSTVTAVRMNTSSKINTLLRNKCSASAVALDSILSHSDLITECDGKICKEKDQRGKSFCFLFVPASSFTSPNLRAE